jgi:hypothetical protein
MPGPTPLPIACDLGALSSGQRAREQELLAEFRAIFRDARETEQGYSVAVPDDPLVLSRLGEFLGLERLCCPFLTFDLSVPAGRGVITLQIYGRPGSKSLLRSEFFAQKRHAASR